MNIVLVLTSFVVLGALGLGLFELLFRKGRRVRGSAMIAGSCLGAVIVGAMAPGGSVPVPDGEQVEINRAGASEEVGEPVLIAQVDPKVAAGEGREDGASDVTPEIAARLSDPASLTAYCRSMDLFDTLYQRADEKFGRDPSQEKDAWIAETDQVETEAMINQIGVAAEVLANWAYREHWLQRCTALEAGWSAIELDGLEGVTLEDAAKASTALELAYRSLNVSREFGEYVVDRYDAVGCRPEEVSGYWFAGCRFEGDRLVSPPYMFLVGRIDDAASLVIFGGNEKSHFEGISALPFTSDAEVPIAFLIEYPIPFEVAEVRSWFE